MQVKQHHEKLQQEREEAGIHKLQASLPKLCRPVLAMALKDCQFDADRALLMLRQFQSDMFDDLAVIHRKRKRLEASAKHHRAEHDSDSGDDRKRRRHKSSSHVKSKKKSRHKEDKHKRSKHKHKHKKRRRSDSGSEGTDSGGEEEHLDFGAFGIIRESDYALKKPEFAAWASEVKHIDIESLPKCATRNVCILAKYLAVACT